MTRHASNTKKVPIVGQPNRNGTFLSVLVMTIKYSDVSLCGIH